MLNDFIGAILAITDKVISRTILMILSGAVVLSTSLPSQAKSFRVDQLPNGEVFDCSTCHVSQTNRSRNPFGHEVDVWLNRSNVEWSSVYFLDSDGDGYTNGRELGDPCGDWRSGRTPTRTTDISNPGDPDSVPPGNPGPTCTCGNGVVDPGEECDDGNLIHKDRCSNQCEMTTCGNGVVDSAELCDDGNEDNTDECLTTCEFARCGDGFLQAGKESCDDGNLSNSDDCLNSCKPAECGDGYYWPDQEACDNGADNSDTEANACRSDCALPYCGDGVMDDGERCDDGTNLDPNDLIACTSACPAPVCGNGQIEFGEQCDGGNANNNSTPDACRKNCREAVCGDFVIDTAEECDDGPIGSNQCSAACELEITANTEASCTCLALPSSNLSVHCLWILVPMLIGPVRRRRKIKNPVAC